WLGRRQQLAERKAGPWDDHRPTLDAAVAVDPLLLRELLQQILDRVGLRLVDHPADFYRPRRGLEALRQVGHALFFGGELVIVVVPGNRGVVGEWIAQLVGGAF